MAIHSESKPTTHPRDKLELIASLIECPGFSDSLDSATLSDLELWLEDQERIASLQGLGCKTDWSPSFFKPFRRQAVFLGLKQREALYGGAAGGGKSFCILGDVSQWIDQPEYSALILRRQFAQLELNKAILNEAKQWWMGRTINGERIHYTDKTKTFTFPSGAKIAFGHMEHENDKYRYQGAQFHRIYFDELTQFTQSQYEYMFSRVRRVKESVIPTCVRSTSNPGGIGHSWVREFFISDEAAEDIKKGIYKDKYMKGRRVFVPSRKEDNIHLDQESYDESLAVLDPITRAQLARGDWTAAADGRFKPHWFGRYSFRGDYIHCLARDGRSRKIVTPSECLRFFTIDPAGTGQDMAKEAKGHQSPSYAVCSIWDLCSDDGGLLFLREVVRGRYEAPDFVARIKALAQEWNPEIVGCEEDGMGKTVCQLLEREGLPVKRLKTGGKDKLTRSAKAQLDAESGRFFLPEVAHWLEEWEAEVYSWTGMPGEQADQVDTVSYASIMRTDYAIGPSYISSLTVGRGI